MTFALEIKNLTMRFGGVVATNNLSFHIGKGESLGLIGPNGAGKTTVFSQIMGELRQNSGDVYLFGEDISALPTHARIVRGVSRTYQIPKPFSDLSIRENIGVGLMPNSIRKLIFSKPDFSREVELARSVGFETTDLDRVVSEISMGDLRKLEFARTLATGAQVLLLDEVFAGLTAEEIAMISGFIQKLRGRGFTFLMVSHDIPAMEPLVDRVIAIERGALLAEGSLSEVLADPMVRSSYLGDV